MGDYKWYEGDPAVQAVIEDELAAAGAAYLGWELDSPIALPADHVTPVVGMIQDVAYGPITLDAAAGVVTLAETGLYSIRAEVEISSTGTLAGGHLNFTPEALVGGLSSSWTMQAAVDPSGNRYQSGLYRVTAGTTVAFMAASIGADGSLDFMGGEIIRIAQ